MWLASSLSVRRNGPGSPQCPSDDVKYVERLLLNTELLSRLYSTSNGTDTNSASFALLSPCRLQDVRTTARRCCGGGYCCGSCAGFSGGGVHRGRGARAPPAAAAAAEGRAALAAGDDEQLVLGGMASTLVVEDGGRAAIAQA